MFEEAQRLAAPHPLGRVRFDGCRVPDDALLGERDRGFHLGMAALDHIRPTAGAAASGVAAVTVFGLLIVKRIAVEERALDAAREASRTSKTESAG